MTTAYTRADLENLRQTFFDLAPKIPKEADLGRAPRVNAVTMAGSDAGLLLRLSLRRKPKQTTFFLNCVICQYLFAALNDAAAQGGWWKSGSLYERDNNMGFPISDDIAGALNVSSITTTAAPSGILVNFGGTGDSLLTYMPEAIAAELHEGIKLAGNEAGWWGKDFVLIASDGARFA